MTISIKQQIKELEWELGKRRSLYARKIKSYEMEKSVAEFKIGCIEAAIQSLKDKLYTGAVPAQQVVQAKLF